MNLLGVDIGTTSVKAAVFDGNGERLALRKTEYMLDTDPATGYIELSPEKYTDICREMIDGLASEYKIDALAIDSQGETMIVTDGNGVPLYPAINWMDCRAEKEAAAIKENFGLRGFYSVTGQPEITGGWPACKLLWMKHNHSEIAEKIKKVFLLEDWIIYSLCGEFVTEKTLQSSSGYFDIKEHVWWDEMLDFIGYPCAVLPRVLPSATAVGEYKGIKIVTGALDQVAGSLGCGVGGIGGVSEMTGTIMAVCAPCAEIPEYNPDSIIPCHMHAIDGLYCRLLWSSAAGLALKWFRDKFMPGAEFSELDGLAGEIPPGADGLVFLPHLCGSSMPVYNPDARGVFSGLTLAHGAPQCIRAILEAIAFTLRGELEYIGLPEDGELRITGGGAAGMLWPQIKADVTGRTLSVPCESETACLGAAMLAGVGIGFYPSIPDAAARAVKIKRTFTPSGADYGAAYAAYLALDSKLNTNSER